MTDATTRRPTTRTTRPATPSEAATETSAPAAADSGHSWSARPWIHPAVRREEAKATRDRVPRADHAAFVERPGRDPIAILAKQEEDRLQELLPLRHSRMAESAFAYYRGTPAVMAFDLAEAPVTGIQVQASGDAHLSNFGLFASPERTLVFDANDFDETMPGPWEWDVKRLAASMVIAGRANGFGAADNREITMRAVAGYREWMARYAAMQLIEILYARITAEDIIDHVEAEVRVSGRFGAKRRKLLESIFSKAREKNGMRAFTSLTTLVDGRRTIREDPPVLTHVSFDRAGRLEDVFTDYRASLPESRRDFLERYQFVDVALKVVGVGSVGTRCFVIVLQGRDEDDALILQVKEATASVLAPHLATSAHEIHGQRVVVGQQLMQANSDIFLGWARTAAGRDYYFRQLWDMKGSIEPSTLKQPGLGLYGSVCGRALALAHARTGDAVAISGYLGKGDSFDGAIADFAETYADINARDHAAYVAAIEAEDLDAGCLINGVFEEMAGGIKAALGSLAFLVLAPGIVAGLMPWLITRWQPLPPSDGPGALRWTGLALSAAGLAVVLEAFVRFAWEGLGTPAPVAPARTLIVSGFYRFVRNPMYVALTAMIFGQAVLFASWSVGLYGLVIAAAFLAFVHLYEEPTLHDAYGEEYAAYCAVTPRWIPRLRR